MRPGLRRFGVEIAAQLQPAWIIQRARFHHPDRTALRLAEDGRAATRTETARDVLAGSPFTEKRVGVPLVRRKAVIGTTTTVEKPPPEAYWQSRQWQFITASGSADTS